MQFDRMKRREFIVVLGAWAASLTDVVTAQSPTARRIGVLMGTPEIDPESQTRIAAFRSALKELKWTEGRDIHIDLRWAGGNAARTREYAAELVALAPSLILGTNTPTVRALKAATGTIPIVFAGLSDPVKDGLVASLSKPAGNITIGGKWLEILEEISPRLGSVTVIYNPETAPHAIFLPSIERAARLLAMPMRFATVRDTAAIESAVDALEPNSGLIVPPDVFLFAHRSLLNGLAVQRKIPTMYVSRHHVVAGGLISYGSDLVDQFRQSASYVDRILKGEKPADLPVQVPTKFELAVNLKTARALGLEIPTSVLARADTVID
jgi:putative ABC transport system substrate-binding protein